MFCVLGTVEVYGVTPTPGADTNTTLTPPQVYTTHIHVWVIIGRHGIVILGKVHYRFSRPVDKTLFIFLW